jgi:uncharacterized protein YjbI with pentapeptide repeats
MHNCKYEKCTKEVGPFGIDGYCIFHYTGEKNVHKFNQLVKLQLDEGNLNFEGYYFPEPIDYFKKRNFGNTPSFKNTIFSNFIDFSESSFHKATFENAKFLNGCSFDAANFYQGCAFSHSTFNQSAQFAYCTVLGSLSFYGATFEDNCSFYQSKFNEDGTNKKAIIDFSNCKFNGKSTLFNDSIFGGKTLTFSDSIFENRIGNIEGVAFDRTIFLMEEVIFDRAKFQINLVDFRDSVFESKLSFIEVNFENSKLSFLRAKLHGSENIFRSVVFGGVGFYETSVKNKISILNSIFTDSASLTRVKLPEDAYFYFKGNTFRKCKEKPYIAYDFSSINIRFVDIIFPPLRTHFETFSGNNFDQRDIQHPHIKFEYCHLQDCYFIENNMAYFSFHHTLVKDILFINNHWLPLKKRKNVLYDEIALQRFGFNDIYNKRIIELYIQLKAAHDRNADYENAGWFYYNQMELTREMNLRKLETIPFKQRILSYKRKFVPHRFTAYLFYIYRVTAGYGQQPIRSAISFLIALSFFSVLHMFNGFVKDHHWHQYEINFSNLVSPSILI